MAWASVANGVLFMYEWQLHIDLILLLEGFSSASAPSSVSELVLLVATGQDALSSRHYRLSTILKKEKASVT